MPSKLSALISVGSSLAVLAVAAPAWADASAWVFIGGGALFWKQGTVESLALAGAPTTDTGFRANGMMTIDVGVGTRPDASFIIGGFFRVQPVFENGVDLAALARVCTRGFQAADFGLALDAGAYLRTWGPLEGGGFMGGLTLGAPLGFTLALQAEVGAHQAVGVGVVAGIDLLRFTVYRQTMLKWWKNPSPAWTRHNPERRRRDARGSERVYWSWKV